LIITGNLCYTTAVQTPFYVSGFLYNSKTNQILLLKSQKSKDLPAKWSTIGSENNNGEDAKTVFQKIVSRLLNLNLKAKNIYPVYDYFNETINKENFVFYAEVKSSRQFKPQDDRTFCWITFTEISKLSFPSWTKQDIIVGERVIKAKYRDMEASKQASIASQILNL
jgi:hypothetical protein